MALPVEFYSYFDNVLVACTLPSLRKQSGKCVWGRRYQSLARQMRLQQGIERMSVVAFGLGLGWARARFRLITCAYGLCSGQAPVAPRTDRNQKGTRKC